MGVWIRLSLILGAFFVAAICTVIQGFHYLKYGERLDETVAEAAKKLGLDISTGWIGLDHLTATTSLINAVSFFALAVMLIALFSDR